MAFNPTYYFNGARWWMKALRFLHLVEDEAVQLSMSGITLWITTLNNVHAIAFTHDQTQMFFGTIAHISGMVGHAVKRWQTRK